MRKFAVTSAILIWCFIGLVACNIDSSKDGKTVYDLEQQADKVTMATVSGPMVFERPQFVETRDSTGKVFIRANDGRRYLFWQGHVFEGD